MLTDLHWIAPGKPFPPPEEKERLKEYEKTERMFRGDYGAVFGIHFANKALELRLRDARVSTIINYPQLLTKKTADFVCGEPPVIDAGDRTDALQDALDAMEFSNVLYEGFMDVSRYGEAVMKVLKDRVSITPPRHWFPVVDAYDRKNVLYQVIAFVAGRTICVEIHEAGRYERRTYEVETQRGDKAALQFGRLLGRESFQTGLDENAVQVLTNVTTSDSLYGVSDYDIVEDTLRQLLWRIFCVERILDKHSAPSLVGPPSMKEKDPITGLWLVKPGNFFEVGSSDTPSPKYLTWDGNLQAVQWEIEWLTNQMYTLSEMGAAFLEGAGQGEVNSGRALRLRMTSPIIKARRLVGINDQTVKKIIRCIAAAGGIPLDTKDIATTWKDGLPNDITEDSELYERATGGKAFMSQFTAIKRFGNLDDTAAEEELAAIEGEHAAAYEPMEWNIEQNRQADREIPAGAGGASGGGREAPEGDAAGI